MFIKTVLKPEQFNAEKLLAEFKSSAENLAKLVGAQGVDQDRLMLDAMQSALNSLVDQGILGTE